MSEINEINEDNEVNTGLSDKGKVFPKRLYSIINDSKNHQYINWMDNGENFIIFNPSEFAEKILIKKELGTSNYSSFIRQLNIYDFHKIKNKTKDQKNDVFFHKYFIRDNPDVLKLIKRKKNSSVLIKQDDILLGSKRSNNNNDFISEKSKNIFDLDFTNQNQLQLPNFPHNISANINPGLILNNSNNSIDLDKKYLPLNNTNEFVSTIAVQNDKKFTAKININDKNSVQNNTEDIRKEKKKPSRNIIHSLYTCFLKNVRILLL